MLGKLFLSPINPDSESTPPAENVVITEPPEVKIEQTPTVVPSFEKDVEEDSTTSDVVKPSVAEERKQPETKKETTEVSTPKTTKKVEIEPRKIEETDAQKYNEAVATRDISALQKLADKGYARAYAELATLYLDNREYSLADTYAQKAYSIFGKLKASSEKIKALKVMERLDALGYYDDKKRPEALKVNEKVPKFA